MKEETRGEENNKLRSDQQNRALHLWFQLLADELNLAGLDLKLALKELPVDVPATKNNIKEALWRPIQKTMVSTASTKELTTGQIDAIWEVINRHFGNLGFEVPRFPSIEELLEYEAGKDYKTK